MPDQRLPFPEGTVSREHQPVVVATQLEQQVPEVHLEDHRRRLPEGLPLESRVQPKPVYPAPLDHSRSDAQPRSEPRAR